MLNDDVDDYITKVVSIETKWRHEKVEKGSASRGTCEGLCSPKFSESYVAVGGNERWSHREFCASVGEACVVSIKVA